MRSILDKALAALLEGKREEAEQLFHDFVIERARQVNESIVDTGAADVDTIVEGKTYKRGEDEDTADKKKEDQRRKDASKQKREVAESAELAEAAEQRTMTDDEICEYLQHQGRGHLCDEWLELLDREPQEAFLPLANQFFKREGLPFQAVDVSEASDGNFVWTLTSAVAESADELAEGKTFKRGEDEEADSKKKQDQQRKQASKQKREMAEGEEVAEGKTFKRGEDDEADTKKKQDQQRKQASKQKREMTEGKLELTQSEDGTLSMTHHVGGSDDAAMPAPVEAPALPAVDPVAPVAVDTTVDAMGDMDPMADAMGDDLDAPMPGVEDLVDDQAFESLKESLADELEKIIVGNKDHTYANGDKSTSNDHSPVPNVPAKDRMEKAHGVAVKGDEHNGFDREPAPKSDKQAVRTNVRNSAEKGMDKVAKEGDSKALLNQIGDDKAAKSPISGK